MLAMSGLRSTPSWFFGALKFSGPMVAQTFMAKALKRAAPQVVGWFGCWQDQGLAQAARTGARWLPKVSMLRAHQRRNGWGLMQAPLMAHGLPSASSGMGVALMRWGGLRLKRGLAAVLILGKPQMVVMSSAAFA